MACEGVVPFDILGHPRYIVNLSLVEPLDKEFECSGILVTQFQLTIDDSLVFAIDGEGLVEELRMMDEEVLMERPLAPFGSNVDI